MERHAHADVITKTNIAPPLTRKLLIAFAVGSLAESVVLTTLTDFVLIFYNQIMGLPAHLVGLGVLISLVINACADPLVGSWSDRTRSRYGRRHLFMAASVLPITLAFFAAFSPPAGLSQAAMFAWMTVTNVVLLQAISFFHTPHLALGGEFSAHYTERSKVMSYNTFFLWVGGALRWWLAFGYFFRAAPGYPNGLLNPTAWPPFVAAMTVCTLVFLSASTWFTRERIPWLPKMEPGTPHFGPAEFVRDMLRAVKNRSYLALLLGFFFLSMMQGVRAGLWLYIATFYFRLTSAQLTWFVAGSLVGYVLGSAVVTRLHERFDKRATLVVGILVYSLGPAIPMVLGLTGVLTAQTPFLLAILVALVVLEWLPLSITTTTVYSALADIADENELTYGIRQEGVLYSTRTFFAKVDQAMGAALAGAVLTLIAFPLKAVPGHVAPDVLAKLLGAFALSTIPGLVAMLFYARLKVTRDSHARVRAALDARGRAPPSPPTPPSLAPTIAAPAPTPSPL